MASYPTTVKTYATRNNGDTIQAAHVNELGDEITAIEDGLLNGTAPLNSSRSTVATLSVTGNSTLAAVQAGASTATSLTVTNGAALAGGVTLSGAITTALLSTGDTNNYDPAGSSGVFVIRALANSSNSTISGLVPHGTGRFVLLYNVGTGLLGVKHLGGGSASSNQIYTRSATDTSIATIRSMLLYHDPGGNFWLQVN